jgi:hypothetical protein
MMMLQKQKMNKARSMKKPSRETRPVERSNHDCLQESVLQNMKHWMTVK